MSSLYSIFNKINSIEESEEVMNIIYSLDKQFLKLELCDNLDKVVEKTTIPQDIITLADQRIQAKQEKDYAHADQIRQQLTDMGREIKDTKDGYELNKI